MSRTSKSIVSITTKLCQRGTTSLTTDSISWLYKMLMKVLCFDYTHDMSILYFTRRNQTYLSSYTSLTAISYNMDINPVEPSAKKAQDILVAHTGAWVQASSSCPPKSTVRLAHSFQNSLALLSLVDHMRG
jgi:hypothetical protein